MKKPLLPGGFFYASKLLNCAKGSPLGLRAFYCVLQTIPQLHKRCHDYFRSLNRATPSLPLFSYRFGK